MKKIIYSLFGLFLVSSCSLDTTPTDRYLESTFWSNDAQVDAGLTSCYQALRDTYLYGGTATALFNDVVTPNQYMYDNTYGFGVIAQGAHTLTNSDVIKERWGSCYKGIGRCNSFLDKIAKYEMEDADKKLRVAQAKFLRALYYSILTDYYGAAPLILSAPDPATQSKLPRDPKSKIVEQIIKDLNEASADLPPSYSSANDIGRATKGAAYALKARVSLYNSMWEDAAKAARDVVDLNKYAIIDDYRSIFKRDNEGNKEVIFDVQSLNPNFTTNFDLITRQYNTHAPLLDLCKAYDNADGTPYTGGAGAELAVNRDPRFYATITYPGSMFMGVKVTDTRFASGRTLCTAKKFSVYDEAYVAEYDWADINYIVIRFADVKLMLAEAVNEIDGPTQEVYDALNSIRTRKSVGLPAYSIADNGFTKDQMREVIRKERRVELACEGLYYSDIRRWKIAKSVMNGDIYDWYGKRIETRIFQDKDYLWPIPEVQLKENPDLAPNNPGWE